MRTRNLAGASVIAAVLLALCYAAWAEDNPDRMPWRKDVEAAFKEADEKGMPIIIEFSCEWNSG